MPSTEHTASVTDRQPSRWAGLAPEERRADRRELLLDAAFDLLGTEGASATTVRAVCQHARLNPRYFYEGFNSLDDLVVAVYDRVVQQLGAAIAQAMAEAQDDPRSKLRAAIARLVEFVDDDRRRARVLYVEALGNEALNRRRIRTGHAVVAQVEAYAVAQHGPPPEGELIGGLAAAILVGGLSESLVAWIDGRLDLSRDQLIDDATTLLVALAETAVSTAAARQR